MEALVLAAAQELVYLGAALAVALLLVFQLRLAQRFKVVEHEVERLKRAHRDGTLDARSRLEEASKALEALEEAVTPKLASLEPHLADVGARLDELEERVAALVPALEAAGRRETESSEVLADARTRLEQAEEVARDVSERFGVLEEGLRDARDRMRQAERGIEHLRTSVDERVEAVERRLSETVVVGASTGREGRRAAVAPDASSDETPDEMPDEAPAAADTSADETLEEEVEAPDARAPEPANPTMAGVIIIVVALAVLTMLLHWMGVGR